MNKKQTLSIIQLTTTYYPNLKIDDVKFTLEAWHFILQDYDYDTVIRNLKAYVKTGAAFAPSVGQLIPQKRVVPSIEETSQMLLAMDERNKNALSQEEREKVFEQMDEILGVTRERGLDGKWKIIRR